MELEVKYPLEYEVEPERLEEGNHWLTVKLRNVGSEDLSLVKVQLNSLDSSSFIVDGLPKSFMELKRDETEEVPFEVTAFKTGDISVSLVARKGLSGPPYYWESSPMSVVVGKERAELKSMFVLTHPHVKLGETLEVEAMVHSMGDEKGLVVEFWSQVDGGPTVALNRAELRNISPGEDESVFTSLKVEKKGYHTVHAYLYDETGRIDYKSDTILVK